MVFVGRVVSIRATRCFRRSPSTNTGDGRGSPVSSSSPTVAVEPACQTGCVWEAPFPPAFPREITFHPQNASSVPSCSDLERRRLLPEQLNQKIEITFFSLYKIRCSVQCGKARRPILEKSILFFGTVLRLHI